MPVFSLYVYKLSVYILCEFIVLFSVFKMGLEHMTYILYRDVPLFVLYWLPSSICIFVFLIIPIVWIVRCTIKLCSKSYSIKYDQCVGKVFNMFGPRRAHAVARLSSDRKILKSGEEDSADKSQTNLFILSLTFLFIISWLYFYI